jgi:hypothetical protein
METKFQIENKQIVADIVLDRDEEDYTQYRSPRTFVDDVIVLSFNGVDRKDFGDHATMVDRVVYEYLSRNREFQDSLIETMIEECSSY